MVSPHQKCCNSKQNCTFDKSLCLLITTQYHKTETWNVSQTYNNNKRKCSFAIITLCTRLTMSPLWSSLVQSPQATKSQADCYSKQPAAAFRWAMAVHLSRFFKPSGPQSASEFNSSTHLYGQRPRGQHLCPAERTGKFRGRCCWGKPGDHSMGWRPWRWCRCCSCQGLQHAGARWWSEWRNPPRHSDPATTTALLQSSPSCMCCSNQRETKLKMQINMKTWKMCKCFHLRVSFYCSVLYKVCYATKITAVKSNPDLRIFFTLAFA